ncbi:MAG TPA: OmpH family outer membrane protein, partial [Ignavibacteriaceae bacterium]|nr:OmpH family outer membrane protein [Ignavibacteriaceae bacterium]
MKTRVFSFLLFSLLFFSGMSFGQLKIGYVDSKTILNKIPDAQDAKLKLDALIRDWQAELSKMEAAK